MNDEEQSGLDSGEELIELAGEAAGEVDVDPAAPFFVSKKAAAVLKHGILTRYITPWASKVGSTAEGHRVVYVDGYAGPGRYDDETDGSPALILNTARNMAYRNIECHFVEKSRKFYRNLEVLVADARATGMSCYSYKGKIDRHLEAILKAAGNAPLFVFLDPFGLALPFDSVVNVIMGGARSAESGTKTEVLLNFSANAVRRIGGFLEEGKDFPHRDATLASMDAACGGDWWREVFQAHDSNEARVEAIADEFMTRAASAAQSNGWSLPVRNRADLQPVYHLVFLSRHQDGMWLFGDSLAGAQEDWRRHLTPPPTPDDGALFQLGDLFEHEESDRKEHWVREIKENLKALLVAHPSGFSVSNYYGEVFGEALGLARTSVLRRAVKELYNERVTSFDGKGKIEKFYISPYRP